MPPTITPTLDIKITKSALEHLKNLAGEQTQESWLRMSVRQGGCAGMTYVMSFDDPDHTIQGDKVYDFEGLKVVCDPMSLSCIDGLVVDYNPSIVGIGGEFQFINPKAIDTCCCGQSFATTIA
jgi:iron-sulfur cluster assembly protein